MLIECLIERDGPTVMHINGFKHAFEKNEQGHSVANVCSREHQEWLLGTGNFRAYEPLPSEAQEALVEPDGQAESNPEQEHGDGANAQVEMGKVFLASNGQPFRTKDAAKQQAKRTKKKTGTVLDVVPVPGGFGLVKRAQG